MAPELQDLYAFLAVVRAGGFRQAARSGRDSASKLSEAASAPLRDHHSGLLPRKRSRTLSSSW